MKQSPETCVPMIRGRAVPIIVVWNGRRVSSLRVAKCHATCRTGMMGASAARSASSISLIHGT